MDVSKALLARDSLGFRNCFVGIVAMKADFGAEAANGVDLEKIRILGGHINDDARAENSPGVSERLAVIPRAGGDELIALLALVARPHEINSATDFEWAGGLKDFGFDVIVAAELLGKRRAEDQRSLAQMAGDDRASSDDIVVGRRLQNGVCRHRYLRIILACG